MRDLAEISVRIFWGAVLLLFVTVPHLSFAASPPVIKFSEKGLTGSLERDGMRRNLRLVLPKGAHVEVFELADPARAVVDITGSRLKVNKVYPIKDDQIVQKIRIGTHPDRLRIVVDLSPADGILLSDHQDGEVLNVELGSRLETMSPTPVVVKPTPSPPSEIPTRESLPSPTALKVDTPAPTETAAPTDEPTDIPTSIQPTSTPTIEVSPTVEESEVPVEASPSPGTQSPTATAVIEGLNNSASLALTGIEFAPLSPGETPTVKLQLSKRSEFRLVKDGDRFYKLSISDCTLGSPALQYAYFPPGDFAGFTVIQPSIKGTGLEIIIGVEQGTRISAIPAESDIYLRASTKSEFS